MSIFVERNNLFSKNPFAHQQIPLTNTTIKLVKIIPTSKKSDLNKNEPLDYFPRNSQQITSKDIPQFITPKKINIQKEKIYSANEIKSNLNVAPNNFKLVRKISKSRITENKPENNPQKKKNIPKDDKQLDNPGKIQSVILSSEKAEIKINNEHSKIPMNNEHKSHRSPKLRKSKKNNNFSDKKRLPEDSNNTYNKVDVIKNKEIKISNEKITENKNSADEIKRNLNEEKLKEMKLDGPRDKNIKIEKTEKTEINMKIKNINNGTGKIAKEDNVVKLKQNKPMDIIQNQNNKPDKKEKNTNIIKEEKETVNKDKIFKTEISKEDKKQQIEINIIKNDINKKYIINNPEKKSKEKIIKTPDNNESKTKKKSLVKKQVNNSSEENSNNIDDGKPKMKIIKRNKIYDIIFDEITEDTNIESEINKIVVHDKNIKTLNDLKASYRDKETDKNKKSNEKKDTELNNEQKKSEEYNNIISIKKKELNPKDSLQNKHVNSLIKPAIIKKDINKEVKSVEDKFNKKSPYNLNNNIKINKEQKENKKFAEYIVINKKVEPEPINFYFIKQIIKRYQDSPPREISKSRSGIFSKNTKNSPTFIFNKIITNLESVKNVVTKNISHPLEKNIDKGIHFNPNDFKYLGVIGRGEYGKIYLVQWVANNNQFYAMKYEKFKNFEDAQKNQNNTRIIKNFIEMTKSEGIIKIYGEVCLKSQDIYHYYTLMEKSERDVEQECIVRNKYLKYYTEKNLIDILCQLILTCASLQKHSICHGDIKPQNILILDGRYKLCDFGEVKIVDSEGYIEQDIGGTELYMSPKLFFGMKNKKKTVIHNVYKSDVFSVALCMLLMATFNYDILVQIRELVDMGKMINIVNKFLSKRYSADFIQFLLCMLEIDENKRPDFIQLESKLVKKEK